MENKIFAISDLHLSNSQNKPMDIFGEDWQDYWDKIKADWRERVGASDIVLVPGDISWAMDMDSVRADIADIATLPGRIVILRGNHDYWWNSVSRVRAMMDEIAGKGKMFAVQNDVVRIDNVLICGSRGWLLPESFTDENDPKIYEREKMRLRMSLDSAMRAKNEGDRIVVIMHYPPMDMNLNDSEFTDILQEYNVDTVVFGHVHTRNKYKKLIFDKNGIRYYLTSCNLVNNKLIEIE